MKPNKPHNVTKAIIEKIIPSVILEVAIIAIAINNHMVII
jgi:hypothetical protein